MIANENSADRTAWANGYLAARSYPLQRALEEHARLTLLVSAHEATVLMLREAGDGKAARAAQARLNGMRSKLGYASSAVRQAGGHV